jgi:glycine betaine transporter
MFRNPLLLIALALTCAVAVWGLVDNAGLASYAKASTQTMFQQRGWFVMLTVSVLFIMCLLLALSRYGKVKLGRDDDQPEFSTVSWLTMLFAAGMGVGLLYNSASEPITHYLALTEIANSSAAKAGAFSSVAKSEALFITNFHWGLHAWAIYGITGLVIAYFGFRKDCPYLVSAPLKYVFGRHRWAHVVGWLGDLLAIYAIAIGLAGSMAMGVFQIQGGVETLFNLQNPGMTLSLGIFVVLVVASLIPCLVDLSKGMATLSNTALGITIALMIFILLEGPTYFMMSAITEAIGKYAVGVFEQGFKTYTFFDQRVEGWFQTWTLTYMVWWLAWAPFVGVFIARISKGRTIREFIVGVWLVPTVFSIIWFGVFGSMGFYQIINTPAGATSIKDVVQTNVAQTTFFLLQHFPLSQVTSAAVVIAAFLFVVTSVVSAAFVLGMFSTGGDPNPSVRIKLVWGVILSALGLVMIISGSIDAVKAIIALSALPFVFIVLLLMVTLLKALKVEAR